MAALCKILDSRMPTGSGGRGSGWIRMDVRVMGVNGGKAGGFWGVGMDEGRKGRTFGR